MLTIVLFGWWHLLLGAGAVFSGERMLITEKSDSFTWDRNHPESCECAETRVSRSQCELFRCKCTCDLTDGLCDYNCCCDPDCSEEQVKRFKALDVCNFQGYESSLDMHCDASVGENGGEAPKEPAGGQPAAERALMQALCVERKNTAIREEFYTDSDLETKDVFDKSKGEKQFSYIEDIPSVKVDEFFDQNDTIAAFTRTEPGGKLISNGPGYFQLPAADWTGECNDQTYVTFENSVEPQFCTRTLSDDATVFAAQCEQQFSVRRFVTDLYVAKNAELLAADGSTGSGSVKQVEIGEVYFESFTSGTITSGSNFTSTWIANDCNTTAFVDDSGVSNAGYDPTLCSSYSASDDISSLEEAAALCQGFVKAVHYSIKHKTTVEATISSVVADLTVSDVPITDTQGGSVAVTQCFSLEFLSGDKVKGNRPRSGNPGYLMGKPIRFGFRQAADDDDELDVISPELASGLVIPSPFTPYDASIPEAFGRAICPQLNQAVGTSAVQFGYDVSTGCQLQLNRSALINMCCAGSGNCAPSSSGAAYTSPYISPSTGVPYFLDFEEGYIGNYGNADEHDIEQWSILDYNVPVDARIWAEATSTCSNMPTNLNFQFLIAPAGSKGNVQMKIISSVADVETADWVMRLPPGDEASIQTFPLGVTVSFITRDDNPLESYSNPAPPVLFYVPYDVLYPFSNKPVVSQ